MTLRLALSLLLLPNFGWAKPLSLSEAIHKGLQTSPTLLAEQQRQNISELELKNRANAFYPRLDLASSHGVGETNVSTPNDPWQSSVQLKLTETLYDNGTSLIRWNQGKQDRELARLNYERVRDDLIYQITERFYAFSKAHLVLEAVKSQKDLLEKQFESVGQKYRQGLRTKRDFLRFKAQAQRIQMDTRAAAIAKEKVRLELRKLLGLSLSDPNLAEFELAQAEEINVSGGKAPPPVQSTYEYKIAKVAAETKKFDIDLAERRYWPELNLVSGAYYQNNSYLNSGRPFRDTEGYGWNILLQLNYNFWDWGERRREVEKAQAAQLVFDHELRKRELETEVEIRQLMNELKNAQENLVVSEDLLKAQSEAYDVIRRDYSEGRAEYQDLITSLNDLLEAKSRYFGSRFDIATLLAKQQYFEGTIYGNYKSKT